jgi:hypothetical protein
LFNDVWHKSVPLKVSIFAWRLLRNRLPTKDNLLSRGVLQHDDISCVGGCGSEENACHLFLGCTTFGSIWYRLLHWLGINFVAPEVLGEHFHQFSHFSGLPQSTYHFLKLIWLVCVWIIWKEMNNRVFNNKALAPAQLTDKVIMISFQWLKANLINFVFNYHDWWRSPLSCMSLML